MAARPDQVTLVPERRAEVTTEGGLDVLGQRDRVGEAVARLPRRRARGEPVHRPRPARRSRRRPQLGSAAVELHTGRYADAVHAADRDRELAALARAGAAAVAVGMALHAGHGLNYQNVAAVARIARMAELNIGHSIVSRAVFVGLERAVREMKACIHEAQVGRFV